MVKWPEDWTASNTKVVFYYLNILKQKVVVKWPEDWTASNTKVVFYYLEIVRKIGLTVYFFYKGIVSVILSDPP